MSIRKKNFLTDLIYLCYIPSFRYRPRTISLRTRTRTEFIRTKDISLVEGERDNFYRGARKVVLTRSGVYELEIIYVDIYIFFHWDGVTRAAFFELKRETGSL